MPDAPPIPLSAPAPPSVPGMAPAVVTETHAQPKTSRPGKTRIAVFSDIHANLEGLHAVLADAEEQNCTEYICLGDIVGYGADPVACLNIVRELNCPVIKGNHDAEAATDHSVEGMNPVAAVALDWTRQQLNDEQRTYLRRLRLVRQIHDFTIVHSSLDQPANWNYVLNHFEAESSIAFQFTQLCFHGHTHIPVVYRKKIHTEALEVDEILLESDSKYTINVGSTGQPRNGDWRVCYVIYEPDKKMVYFRRLEYDIEQAQEKILKAGLPESLATRLAHGR